MPPKAKVTSVEELSLTDEEKQLYYDMNYHEPVGKYRLIVSKPTYPCKNTYDVITSESSVSKLQECIHTFMKQESLSKEQEFFYVEWKHQVLEYLGYCLKKGL